MQRRTACSADTSWLTLGQAPIDKHLLHGTWLRTSHATFRCEICLIPYQPEKVSWQLEVRGKKSRYALIAAEVVISFGEWATAWGHVLYSAFLDSTNIFGNQPHQDWNSPVQAAVSQQPGDSGPSFDDALCCGNWWRALEAHCACRELWCGTLSSSWF